MRINKEEVRNHRLHVGGASISTYNIATIGLLETTDFMSVVLQFQPTTLGAKTSGALRAPHFNGTAA
ncbi:MAG TPA: hypothetical protein VF251_09220 [Pyrinomonadaceae bacterium]